MNRKLNTIRNALERIRMKGKTEFTIFEVQRELHGNVYDNREVGAMLSHYSKILGIKVEGTKIKLGGYGNNRYQLYRFTEELHGLPSEWLRK